MPPKHFVLEALQKLGPCAAPEIDAELCQRRKLGLLDLREWPRDARALDFLEQLERERLAVRNGVWWQYAPLQLPTDAKQQRKLFDD
jgi:hypothetical protein